VTHQGSANLGGGKDVVKAPNTAVAEPGAVRDADARMVAKGGAIQVVGQILNKGLTFLFIAVAVRAIGTAGYGLYREVFQVLTIAATVAAGGFPFAALRFIGKARARNDPGGVRGAARSTLVATWIVSLVVFLALLVLAPQIAGAFEDSASQRIELTRLLRLGALFVPLYATMQVFRLSSTAYKTMVPTVVAGNIVMPMGRLLGAVVAVLAGYAVGGLVVALVLSAGAGMVAGFWYFRRLLDARERSARPTRELGPIVRFALPQGGVALFSTSSLGLGIIILGLFRSDHEVGLFGIAQPLQLLGNMFLVSIVGIFNALVVELYERREMTRLQSMYQTINRWVATFSVPILVALMLQPEFFARLLGGEGAIEAAQLIPIMALGNLFFVGTGPSGNFLSMTGRPLLNFGNSVVAVALYIGLGVWLVPLYGAVGMAIVDAIVTMSVNVARVVEIKVLVGVQPFGRSFVKPIAATLAAASTLIIYKLLFDHSFFIDVAGLLLFGLAYVAVLRTMGLDEEERSVFDAIKAGFLKRFGKKGRARG
jgi:O-antigen/teichoic acid export membrane protein